MLAEIVARLRRPLAAEEKLGFGNTAVVGGLDGWMRSAAEDALEAVIAGNLPRDVELTLKQIHHQWSRYAGADTSYRREVVVATRDMLDGLEGGASAAGAADALTLGALTADPSPNSGSGGHGSNVGRGELRAGRGSNVVRGELRVGRDSTGDRPSPARRTSSCTLNTELTYLKGVGPKRAEALARLGLHTVFDLLYHFPARYEDRRNVKPIARLEVGKKESLCATVLFPAQTRKMGGKLAGRNLTRVRVGDSSGRADLQWWNQPWREKQLQPGMELFVYGTINEFNGMVQIDSPEYEVLGENDVLQVGRIVPIYPMTEGLFQASLRRSVMNAIEASADSAPDGLPKDIRKKYDLMDLGPALRAIHFPESEEAKEKARARLLFEELFLLQVALAQKKHNAHTEAIGIRHVVEEQPIKEFVARLPFSLTGAQKRVMNEIRKDLRSARPMNRLLHGDVGSGKTVVAAYALWSAHVTGHQGALLAPTEILAEQHFSVLQRLLKPHGIEVALLEGSLKAKNKRNILADIAEGRSTVVVGTHAIIQEHVAFHKLGVCVVDEQHRFGVMQRAALQNKGQDGMRPDVLVMTATPIPRTMALTVYGDLDVSVLDELPPGRKPIKTVKLRPAQREKAYKFVLDEIKKGRQAYVVCPLVEESEKLAHLTAATALAERLRTEELHGVRVGLLHGQMDVYEREEEMELFRAGMRDVLVATTVIEVGVDVPNATVMLVEDAERFGLSQLHQLRGRVGRGEGASVCVLLGDPKNEVGRARLGVMTKTQNGFEIAEQDLQLRGPGEFYGTRQSGLPDFRLADIVRDVDVIVVAREAAQTLVAADPQLAAPEYDSLKLALQRFWGEKIKAIQVS